MLALKFYKMCPGGNVTILVEDQGFNQAERSRISAQLMHTQHLYAEQVGFIDFAAGKVACYPGLEMMGGEFCGNACRSFGALLAFNGQLQRRTGSAPGSKPGLETGSEAGKASKKSRALRFENGCAEQICLYGCITSSGVTGTVQLRARVAACDVPDAPVNVGGRAGNYHCEHPVDSFVMARPTLANIGVGIHLSDAESARSEIVELVKGAHLVHLSGISHLLLDERIHQKRGDLLLQATQWRGRFSLSVREAVGVVWYNQNAEQPYITPVVWVKAMRSAHLESACGSGSLALALLLQRQKAAGVSVGPDGALLGLEALQVSVGQPSGSVLDVFLPSDLMLAPAWIDGPVELIATGEVFVDQRDKYQELESSKFCG